MLPERSDPVGCQRTVIGTTVRRGGVPVSGMTVRCLVAGVGPTTVATMERRQCELASFVGWHVVEVGRRQAWPFIGLADPERGSETRLYIDCSFAVLPEWRHLRQHDDVTLVALDALSMLTVEEVRAEPTGTVRVVLGPLVLEISALPNEWTTGDVWWLGAE